MTHPEELLAGYVDGTLTENERAEVVAHLSTCGTCREEVGLATEAVTALADLPEEPVPFGVMNPVTAEIHRRTSQPVQAPWWYRLRWAAGLAAAAALVAVLAVNLPHLGGGRAGGGAPRGVAPPIAAGPGLEATAGTVPLEIQPNVNYDAAKLETLANDAARQAAPDFAAAGEKTVSGSAMVTAQQCLAKTGGITEDDRLIRLIQAKFQGTPAYLGVYLQSPGANQPADRVVIWVVADQDCSILSFSSKRL